MNSATWQSFGEILLVFVFTFLGRINSTLTELNVTVLEESTDSYGPLPGGWGKFCALKNTSHLVNRLDYRCVIDKASSGVWKLETLRPWINSSDVSYTMEVECIGGANVSLPWPMKAQNLVGLKVTNCVLEDYFGDHGNLILSTIPDQLDFLELSNIKIMISLSDLIRIGSTIHKLDKDYQCGSEDTLVRFVFSNISYRFLQQDIQQFLSSNGSDDESNIIAIGNTIVTNSLNTTYKCIYRRLEYYERSEMFSKFNINNHMNMLLSEYIRYPVVRIYNLSMTGINRVHEQIKIWYHFFNNLEYMDLSRNDITELQFDDSARVYQDTIPNLILDLSYNKISVLTANHLYRLSLIQNLFINITGNPINCSCAYEFKQLINVIKNPITWKNKNFARYEYWKYLRCHEPQSLKDRSLISVKETDLPCLDEPKYTQDYGSIVGMAAFVFFLIVIIISLTKFKREIRILTYTRLGIFFPCQNEELDENKTYDAFVSYSSADQEWVSEMFGFIENSGKYLLCRFRFCLHQRDFIPGKTILHNVIDSVESSRHTVIVLSRNYLNSHFCMYEFQEAFRQSIIERKKHLIIILLEDVPSNELPNELKRCLKTFTYIRKDDIMFEDRLVYALSQKRTKLRTDNGSTD